MTHQTTKQHEKMYPDGMNAGLADRISKQAVWQQQASSLVVSPSVSVDFVLLG